MGINWKHVIIGIGALGIAYGAYSSAKMDDVATKLGVTLNDLQKKSPIDISDSAVRDAVEKAAKKAADDAVNRSYRDVTDRVTRDMSNEVQKAVYSARNDISEKVAEEITRQVENLDIESLKKQVREKATAKALEKFDGTLDDIADSFKDRIETINSIYEKLNERVN